MGLLAYNPYLFWDHARSLGLAVGMSGVVDERATGGA